MTLLDALAALQRAGLNARPDGENLLVSPAANLTDDLRKLIRENKPAILAFLAEPPPSDEALAAIDAFNAANPPDFSSSPVELRELVVLTWPDAPEMPPFVLTKDEYESWRKQAEDARAARARKQQQGRRAPGSSAPEHKQRLIGHEPEAGNRDRI